MFYMYEFMLSPLWFPNNNNMMDGMIVVCVCVWVSESFSYLGLFSLTKCNPDKQHSALGQKTHHVLAEMDYFWKLFTYEMMCLRVYVFRWKSTVKHWNKR